jgi:hypothetical protein
MKLLIFVAELIVLNLILLPFYLLAFGADVLKIALGVALGSPG